MNQRPLQRRLDEIIYKTEMKFWAVLGSWGCKEKKGSGPIMSNFLGGFFNFLGSKKKKNQKHCSVRTKKLHNILSINFFFEFFLNFFGGVKIVFFRTSQILKFECTT